MTISDAKSQHLTQQELEATLWAAANALRGPVDAGDYKAYVFPVFFFKWISDTYDYWHARAALDWGDELTDEIEASDYQPFIVPVGCRWKDVHSAVVNVGVTLNTALQKIEQANPELVGVFGDINWANRIVYLRGPSRISWTLSTASVSILTMSKETCWGAAYEYLLREFAEASGRKAGEFFTPRHVVHLLVKILQPQSGDSIIDPACGSAGMLVETVNEVKSSGGDPRTLSLHGQEVNLTTSAIAKMNLYLHGLEDFSIKRGDTFSEPRFVSNGKLDAFDVVVANPPFSLQNWGASAWANDPYDRAFCGVPPAKNGDFAWVQHMISSMKEGTGRVGVVMPHGVLFRGGKEGAIRQCLLEKDLLEAVIGLPTNLFYSTSIPVCLLIFRAQKPAERQSKVLFVDASSRFKADTNQNTMSEDDIDTIYAAYTRGEDIAGEDEGLHLRLVDIHEIEENDFDLNIGRYIKTEVTAEIDVEAALASYKDARAELRLAERRLDEKLQAAGFDE